MRKVIGIGETLLDIIFRDNQPTAAVPGGSVFNAIVSLSRTGVPVNFISETGNDRVGDIILRFMRDNRIPTDHIYILPNGKSPVSLAFLDEHSDAEYLFYKNYPIQRLDVPFPRLEEDDIVIIGSYYALNPVLREKVVELLEQARRQKAIVYYDPNFRSAHKEEAIKLAPNIIENLEYADIVRGSEEDFFYMYGLRPTRPLEAVSTIGAGDNFNAGIIFGLLAQGVRHDDLDTTDETTWDAIVRSGMDFAADVCLSFSNSVSPEFAAAHAYQAPY